MYGCNSLPLGGATIEAHDSTAGGTLLGSTTTASDGTFTLTGLSGQTAGNAIVLVRKKTRFNDSNVTLSYTAGTPTGAQWSCGATTNGLGTTLTIATGYHCVVCCADPLPETLYQSLSRLGVTAEEMTYDAVNNWWSSAPYSYAYPGCAGGACACAAATISLTIRFGDFGTGVCQVRIYHKLNASGCPDSTGTEDHMTFGYATGDISSCSPFSASKTTVPIGGFSYCLYTCFTDETMATTE